MDDINVFRLLVFGFLAGTALIIGAWWYTFRMARLRGVPYPWLIATISAVLGTPFLGWMAIVVYLWSFPLKMQK